MFIYLYWCQEMKEFLLLLEGLSNYVIYICWFVQAFMFQTPSDWNEKPLNICSVS